MNLLFEGMYGLGDNIYQRAFLRYFPGAWLQTPWPEIYQGLDLNFVRSGTKLRTQQKNECNTQVPYCALPEKVIRKRIAYGSRELVNDGIIATFRKQFSVSGPLKFDLPSFGDPHPAIPVNDNIAVIRPATVRREWSSISRNPDPRYLEQAADILRECGFFVVSVADIEPGKEEIVGAEPYADLRLHSGELTVRQLCDLYEHAACVVSPVGFSLPMAIAYQTPVYIVAGGRGAHNAPEIITDAEMNLDNVGWAIPDNYCRCTQDNHNCDKRISNFADKFRGWLHETVL